MGEGAGDGGGLRRGTAGDVTELVFIFSKRMAPP